jgi:nucleoside-diphosphate-sugar epimerase
MNTTANKIIILGINGHIGHAAARAFLDAGYEVTGFGRSNKHPVPGVTFIKGDAEDVAQMRAAIGDIDLVFNGLNLPYHQWTEGRMEAQHERVIAALGTSGKTLLMPVSIYNYALTDRVVTPDLPQRPQTPRGEIRARVEDLYRAAAGRGDLQFLMIRAGDFYGPNTKGDWLDLAMFTEAKKGKVALMGVWGVAHAWAYLPDLGRAFVKVAEARDTLGRFENFHFAGHFVTPEEMRDAIAAVAPQGTKFGLVARWMFPLIGLVDPIIRDIAKMAYLWENAMELRDPRLDALLGPDFDTPFAEAMASVATPFFTTNRLAA